MTLHAIEKSKGEESFMIENVGIVYFVSLTFYFGKHDDGRNWWRVVEGERQAALCALGVAFCADYSVYKSDVGFFFVIFL